MVVEEEDGMMVEEDRMVVEENGLCRTVEADDQALSDTLWSWWRQMIRLVLIPFGLAEQFLPVMPWDSPGGVWHNTNLTACFNRFNTG